MSILIVNSCIYVTENLKIVGWNKDRNRRSFYLNNVKLFFIPLLFYFRLLTNKYLQKRFDNFKTKTAELVELFDNIGIFENYL